MTYLIYCVDRLLLLTLNCHITLYELTKEIGGNSYMHFAYI